MATVAPNKVKSTTNPEPNTIRVGKFRIGTSFGGAYGPTSATGFWQGITPPTGGYTVYEDTGTVAPSLHTPQDDNGLIWYANYLGAGGLTTIGEALNYFALSTGQKCVNIDYPDVVTDGLISLHDFGYVPSYPRKAESVFDLSPEIANGMIFPFDENNNPYTLSGNNGYQSFISFGSSFGGNHLDFTTGTIDTEITVCMLLKMADEPSNYPFQAFN